MKIFLVSKENWTSPSRSGGEDVKGLSYVGILPNQQAIKFTSDYEHQVHEGEVMFDPERAEDLQIKIRVFNGKTSYREAKI